VIRAASQRLRPFQVDASRCIGVEIKAANVWQYLIISMAGCELAKAASLVIDTKFKFITWAGLDEIVDKIVRKFFAVAFFSLFAQQGLILGRHELTS
jgi:hypothetical protein